MRLYRKTREQVLELLSDVREAGFKEVRIQGDGDIAEICRLTCLEQGVDVVEGSGANLPALEIHGWKVDLRLEPDGG
jgi:fructose-1,6-bisphosphatase/sedoheptulose 1,7-bisphosphatase-like protein